jgi:hypothetical protein
MDTLLTETHFAALINRVTSLEETVCGILSEKLNVRPPVVHVQSPLAIARAEARNEVARIHADRVYGAT